MGLYGVVMVCVLAPSSNLSKIPAGTGFEPLWSNRTGLWYLGLLLIGYH
jgi:hypothetical protein